MTPRRGESGLCGILPVDKPAGLTSHDVVNRVRRAMGERRIGHAGTLDPMATGLLVVLVGPATRLAPYLTAAEKSYEARIAFGTETDTDDTEGVCTRTAPAPELDELEAAAVIDALVGTQEQLPPDFSAIKRHGVVAHRAARTGKPIELEPRTVTITTAKLLRVDREAATWDVEFVVSKGTYVRAIARDIGRSLGSAAHLSALRRTAAGTLDLEDAVTLAEIESASTPEDIVGRFVDPVRALGLPVAAVTEDGAFRVANGSALDPDTHLLAARPAHGDVAVVYDQKLLAIYRASQGLLRAEVVIPDGVQAGAA